MKTLSPSGLQLLKQFEGCKLKAYLDSADVPTIGIGHIRDVKMGDEITEAQAEIMLSSDVTRYEHCVNDYVSVPINQNQFDALVCFAFNLGCGALKGSTLRKRLNASLYEEAADNFLPWCKARINGKLTRLQGLVTRRESERKLFLT